MTVPADGPSPGAPGVVAGLPGSEAPFTVDADRLWTRLVRLARCGAVPKDEGGGIVRPAFSEAHAEAVRIVASWMADAGLEVGVDETGNLVGLYRGSDLDAPAIGIGSHVDTVPHGGAFDGALGVLAALEAVTTLAERGERLRRSVAVMAFADEEGNTFGIGVLSAQLWTGDIAPERYVELVDGDGRTLPERVAGVDVGGLPTIDRPRLAAYVEAHVEQGPEMDLRGWHAAAVTSIVGIARASVRFAGEPNHAGTTPMALRRDAACAASAFVLAVRALADASDARLVATVGVLEVFPGATNVVPGEARLRVELRTAEPERLEAAMRAIETAASEAARTFVVEAVVEPWHVALPVAMDHHVVTAIRDALVDCGLPPHQMPSWAGHDAKVMARHVPTGMVFVPSVAGVSHSPAEATAPVDCAIAAEVLLRTLRRLA